MFACRFCQREEQQEECPALEVYAPLHQNYPKISRSLSVLVQLQNLKLNDSFQLQYVYHNSDNLQREIPMLPVKNVLSNNSNSWSVLRRRYVTARSEAQLP